MWEEGQAERPTIINKGERKGKDDSSLNKGKERSTSPNLISGGERKGRKTPHFPGPGEREGEKTSHLTL